ncbi:MAG: hypothetical protein ACKOEH_08815 [Actinomycetota bacterium]
MHRKLLLTMVTFVVFAGALMSHRVLAEIAGGGVSTAAGDGPPRLMLALAKQRARNVCWLISGVAPEVAIFIETAHVGGLNVGSTGDIAAAQRRVVVVAKSGEN